MRVDRGVLLGGTGTLASGPDSSYRFIGESCYELDSNFSEAWFWELLPMSVDRGVLVGECERRARAQTRPIALSADPATSVTRIYLRPGFGSSCR
jgi:hypothetical protein